MKEGIQRGYPETRIDGSPVWFHRHGSKMHLEGFDGNSGTLVIQAASFIDVDDSERVARLRIVSHADGLWRLDWDIIHAPEEKVRGHHLIFSSDELQAAFGLSQLSGEHGERLISRYGGSSAEAGKFIRWKDFLNVPCPGTGDDGDPNLSICITPEIQTAVQKLLGWKR